MIFTQGNIEVKSANKIHAPKKQFVYNFPW